MSDERIKWTAEDRAESGEYYDRVWWVSRDEFMQFIVLRVKGEFYVSPFEPCPREQDIGPYPTLKEAKAVCIAMNRLSQ